ncbi:MAG: leucine-rich repeat domain-containing protein [Bacteroidales bacterium]|nr:leucine-rich repeat domain-containing protein [Bacteroidales bacterium]
MKTRKQLIIALVAIALLVILYFLIDENTSYQIVRLKGANVYSNLSKSYMTWMVGNNSDSISALPLCQNDMIYMLFNEDEKEFCYRYQRKDGNILEFKREDFMLLLNDKLISIHITDNVNLNNWLENISFMAVKDLRSVFISGEIPEANIRYLTRLAELKPDVGVYIDSPSGKTDRVLELFNPSWLIDFNKSYSTEAIRIINRSRKLDLLRIDADINSMEEFANLNRLRILFIENFNQPSAGQEFKFPERLRTLIISESGIRNLDFLKNCNNLRELGLIDCESLTDISALNSLAGLTSLHLIACDSLQSVSAAGRIKGLKWISFPNRIDQQEFDLFLSGNRSIEVIDLIGCDSIKDFTRVSGLKRLSCLSIHAMNVPADTLIQLTGLRYLSLPGEIMEDSLKVSLLKEKLPEAIIVPSAGICLGTGWILLFIPVLLISGLFVMQLRKTGHGKKNL